jgi:antitoxin (DNA-binding transcriptional repressor) of toxin-antitoxin stability system
LDLLSNVLGRARSGSPTTVLVYGEAVAHRLGLNRDAADTK